MTVPLRLLHVEDSEDDLLLNVRELRKGGYDVTCLRVETAEQMRAALGSSPAPDGAVSRQERGPGGEGWDLILCDHHMPRFSSFEALAIYKESGLDIPFIIVSGTIADETAVEVMRAGAHDFIHKAKLARLVPAVQRELRAAEERRERRRAEQALREREERFRSVAQSAGDAIVIASSDGTIVSWNKGAQTMFGYAEAEILGQPLTLLIPERYRDAHRKGLERFNATGVSAYMGKTFELEGLRKDGSEFPLEIIVATWKTGAGTFYSAIIRDITKRKRAEAALRLDSAMMANMAEGVYLVRTSDGIIVHANPQFGKMFGYSPCELIGKHVSIVNAPTDTSPHETAEKIMAALHTNSVWSGEVANVKKDGTRFWCQASVSTFEHADYGTVWVAVHQDITERKRAEEQVRQNAARAEALARTAARLNAQLDLDTVLNAVCEETARALAAPAASVTLYEPSQDALILAAMVGLPPEYRADHKPIPCTVYDQYLAQMGPLIVVPDVQAAGLADQVLYTRLGIRTIVTASMRRNSQLVGGLNLYSFGETRTFSDDELAPLQGLADQAAQAIANARLFEQEQAQRGELAALYDLSRDLADAYDFDAILEHITRHAVSAVQVTFARLLLLDRDELVVRAAYPRRVLGRDLQVGRGERITAHPFCQRALAQTDPIILSPDHPEINAAERESLFLGIAQALCLVPLHVGDRTIGLLMLGEARAAEREPFTADKVRLARSIGDQAATALHRALLRQQTEQQLQRLTALRAIDSAITASTDLNLTLKIVLEEVVSQLRVDAAAVLLLKPHLQTLEYAAGRGFRTKEIERARLRLGEGHAGRAALERSVVSIHDLGTANDFLRAALVAGEDFSCYHAAPLIAKGEVKGVLEIFLRAHRTLDEDWFNFFETVARQTAIAIDNASLFTGLQRSNVELVLAYDTTLEGWSRALDLRDKETEGHTQRVTELTLTLAQAMGIASGELAPIRRGALLHDIGKMGIPDSILLKPGPLTDEEWGIMRQHPIFAHDLLAPIKFLQDALDIPYCHHEKWDGTGYPRGLKGEQIPLAARLFAIVDVWDALTSDRPYRRAWSQDRTLEHLRAERGKHFDPQVVEMFLKMLG